MVMMPGFPPGPFSDHRCLGVIDCDRIPRPIAIIILGSILIPSMTGPFVAKHPGLSYDHLPEFLGASGEAVIPALQLFDLSPDDQGGGLSAFLDDHEIRVDLCDVPASGGPVIRCSVVLSF